MKSYFINETFDKAINDYLSSKENPEGVLYNSFLVVVIRMLVNIYGELDIISPYQTHNIDAFNDNLMKFGASEEKIDELKRLLDGYFKVENKNKNALKEEENIYFINVQKCLIDLFTIKRINYGLTESDHKEFFDLLYTPGTSNALRLSYNYKKTDDIYEVAEYYKMAMQIERTNKEPEEKDILGFDIYKLFNVSIADVSKMNSEEVDNLNHQIYTSLDINENAINKKYLLEEKIKELKGPSEQLTTGNGYVDILLIMSVIVTSLMVVFIFGTIVF